MIMLGDGYVTRGTIEAQVVKNSVFLVVMFTIASELWIFKITVDR